MNVSYGVWMSVKERDKTRGDKRTGVVRNELFAAAAAAFRAALSVVTSVTSGLLDVSNPVGHRLQE